MPNFGRDFSSTRAQTAPGRQGPGRAGDAGGNQYAGYRGPIGTRNPDTATAPGSYGLSSSETRAYNAAKQEYQDRSFGKRVVDFLSPIKSIDPQINQPASYANGQYHHGINPAGLAAGVVSPWGSGLVTAPIAGSIYNNMGGHNVVLTGPGGGFSTSYPDGGPGYNSSTGYAGPNTDRGMPQQKADQGGALPTTPNPGGAPFGPQPAPATAQAQAPQAPSMFRPQIPNHSLPYGFNSAFPNSLSEQDKALLYAKALGGGMA